MKEYCIFKNGEFVFTINTLAGAANYVNDNSYVIVEHDKLDSTYQYTLVDGKVVKGDKWPEPPISE